MFTHVAFGRAQWCMLFCIIDCHSVCWCCRCIARGIVVVAGNVCCRFGKACSVILRRTGSSLLVIPWFSMQDTSFARCKLPFILLQSAVFTPWTPAWFWNLANAVMCSIIKVVVLLLVSQVTATHMCMPGRGVGSLTPGRVYSICGPVCQPVSNPSGDCHSCLLTATKNTRMVLSNE